MLVFTSVLEPNCIGKRFFPFMGHTSICATMSTGMLICAVSAYDTVCSISVQYSAFYTFFHDWPLQKHFYFEEICINASGINDMQWW